MLRFVYLCIFCSLSFDVFCYILFLFIFLLLNNLCKFKFRTWRHLRLVPWLFGFLAFCFMSWSPAHFMPLAFCLSLQCFIYSIQRGGRTTGILQHSLLSYKMSTYVARNIMKNAWQLAIMWGNHKKVQALNFNESLPKRV